MTIKGKIALDHKFHDSHYIYGQILAHMMNNGIFNVYRWHYFDFSDPHRVHTYLFQWLFRVFHIFRCIWILKFDRVAFLDLLTTFSFVFLLETCLWWWWNFQRTFWVLTSEILNILCNYSDLFDFSSYLKIFQILL